MSWLPPPLDDPLIFSLSILMWLVIGVAVYEEFFKPRRTTMCKEYNDLRNRVDAAHARGDKIPDWIRIGLELWCDKSDRDERERKKPRGVVQANTPVVCPNGHYVCLVTEELRVGKLTGEWSRAFGEWAQREPEIGEALPIVCARCGEPVIGSGWVRGPTGVVR